MCFSRGAGKEPAGNKNKENTNFHGMVWLGVMGSAVRVLGVWIVATYGGDAALGLRDGGAVAQGGAQNLTSTVCV